jgi:4-methyl-5(b-hydroxyethyl)-thiazole monophosphate biosynthesis
MSPDLTLHLLGLFEEFAYAGHAGGENWRAPARRKHNLPSINLPVKISFAPRVEPCLPAAMPNALVILADGFEEIEAVAPVDLLRRAGAEVTVASLAENRHATGRSGFTVHADAALGTVQDLLFLPGGPGVKNLRADPLVREIVLHHEREGRWLAAICAAPTVLHDCGLLVGRRFTSHPSVSPELPAARLNDRVVTDGKIITSRGAGTAVEFGLELVARLVGKSQANEISKAICF